MQSHIKKTKKFEVSQSQIFWRERNQGLFCDYLSGIAASRAARKSVKEDTTMVKSTTNTEVEASKIKEDTVTTDLPAKIDDESLFKRLWDLSGELR